MKITKQQQRGTEFRVWYSLYGRLLNADLLNTAWKQVRRSNGAPGIDGQSCKAFAETVSTEIPALLEELRTKTYQPSPVKRVMLEKDDGGTRPIGIPNVRDRVMQQALKMVIEPIFEEQFSDGSYGYRPSRSAHQAVKHAVSLMRDEGLEHVVDMDLSKCFDLLNHDLILKAVRRRITDGSILKLIRLFLESGVMEEGVMSPTELGSPQGGVISPLLANIYLDDFDHEMARRGHTIIRYADDILIFKRSRKGAENALNVATELLEGAMKLTVNQRKTHLTDLDKGVRYLGFVIRRNYIQIKAENVTRLKEKLKNATRRNTPVNLEKVISDVNPILRGFVNYYKLANCKTILRRIMEWLRRRLRAIQMKLWKKPAKLHRRLRQLGRKGDFKQLKMGSWKNACCQLSNMAMPNAWFKEIGLYHPPQLESRQLLLFE